MTKKELNSFIERGREVLRIEEKGLEAIRNGLGEDFGKAVEALSSCKGRVIITGLGKSGLVGRKIAATLSSTGTPSFFMHPVEGAHGDLGMISKEDIVIAISNSGETDELNALLPAIKSFGINIISLTSDPESTMGQLSDIVVKVKVPCEACSHGLAPTSSTTATLATGDALAVCLMDYKHFDSKDFRKFHPGGALGKRLTKCVSEMMHVDNIPCVGNDSILADALKVLNEGGLGLVALVDDKNRLTGVITDGDVRRMVCNGEFATDAPASKFMIKKPMRASADMSAALALDIMEEKQITVLPVIDDGDYVVGMIHLHDLLGKGHLKFSEKHKGC